jgi:fumarate hydratase, class II
MTTRIETDSFGQMHVPVDALWGAQTARSLHFFAIGQTPMPLSVIHALAWIKWAAAEVNGELGVLDGVTAMAIAGAAFRVAQGEFDDQFPLSVWQTGSGTQSNMNVNEVIAHLAQKALANRPEQRLQTPAPIHPNDHVNRGQSSNDVFPTAMHIAVSLQIKARLQPALQQLRLALLDKAREFNDVIKIGRTHLQDATPIRLGAEFAAYEAQLALSEQALNSALSAVHSVALGGTAVGTGINTHPEFGSRVVAQLARYLELPLTQATNLYAALSGHEALVGLHASLKMLAIALTKIGNDIRLMGSGPRAGLGELHLPQTEPGSSIMPGKVNPTQVEALCMVCAQVMGHDVAIGIAASQGQFELNVYKPLIALNVLDSVQLLADAMHSFTQHCVLGIAVNHQRVRELLDASLMLVTALTPHIGYNRAAQIAHYANEHGTTLRVAALALGTVSAEDFDRWVQPSTMLAPVDARRSPQST